MQWQWVCSVKCGWIAYTTSTVRDICTFAVLSSVTRPFFVGSLVFMKGTSCCVVRRNFKWNWAVRSCYGKVLQVIGLHDFRCYQHVELTPLWLAMCLCIALARFYWKSLNICFQGTKYESNLEDVVCILRCLQVQWYRLSSRISYLSSYVFLRRRRTFTL